jgi:hypothetical protein
VATIEFRLQKESGDSWEDIQSYPATDRLTRVNPAMTSDELYASTQVYLELG